MPDEIIITEKYDGWEIEVDGKHYWWDHNEPDLGTTALLVLFTDLGYKVTRIVEE